jgi:hypothetical protein
MTDKHDLLKQVDYAQKYNVIDDSDAELARRCITATEDDELLLEWQSLLKSCWKTKLLDDWRTTKHILT